MGSKWQPLRIPTSRHSSGAWLILRRTIFSRFTTARSSAMQLLACARWGALQHARLAPAQISRSRLHQLGDPERRDRNRRDPALHGRQARRRAQSSRRSAVPIGIDDTALAVSQAVAAAAARLLVRTLPSARLRCAARARPWILRAAAILAAARPRTGALTGPPPPRDIHALIRAVAPPFPGAFTDLPAGRLVFAGSRWCDEKSTHARLAPCLYVEDGSLYLDCSDGLRLRITGLTLNDEAARCARRFGNSTAMPPLTLRRRPASRRKIQS